MDEELILSTLGDLMAQVRWTRPGEATPLTHAFVTDSRKVKLFSDVPAAAQPACFQAEWGDDVQQVTGLPYKWVIGVNWIIYHQFGKQGKDNLGALENNCILNGVRAVLAPKPTDPGFPDKRNSLGGLVWHCFINGRLFKDPGDVDGQAMMVVPIKLLVP